MNRTWRLATSWPAGLSRTGHSLAVALGLGLVIAFQLGPLYWVFITSLKPAGTEFRTPVAYWPAAPTWENFGRVLSPEFNLQRALLNSLVVSSGVTVGMLAMGVLAAFALAQLRFRYKVQSLLLMQLAGMTPPVVVLVPTFFVLRQLGLLSTLLGLILPNIAYNLPLGIWLLTVTFRSIHPDLINAARMDGYRPLGILARVILPLAVPGLFSAGVLAFVGSWGEFMLAFTISMGLPSAQTTPVAILGFSQAFELQWAWVSAGIILSVLPPVLLVLLFERYVAEGLAAGAVKY
jgi:multiple sugar transport system permease protein